MTIRSVEHIGQGPPSLEPLLEVIGNELSERGESFVPSDVVSGFIRRTPALSEAERLELTSQALEALSGGSRSRAVIPSRPAGGRISARPMPSARGTSAAAAATGRSPSAPGKRGRSKFNLGAVVSNVTSAIQTGVGIAQQVAPLVAPVAGLINAASAAGGPAPSAAAAPSPEPASATAPAAPPSPPLAAATEPAANASSSAGAEPTSAASVPAGAAPDADRAPAPPAAPAEPTAAPALVREPLPVPPMSAPAAVPAPGVYGGAPSPAALSAYDATALLSLLLFSPELQNALRLSALLGPAAPRAVSLPAPASIAARPTTVSVPLSTMLQTLSLLLGRSMAEVANEDAEESEEAREYLLTDAGEYVVDPGDPVQRAEWVLELFRESALAHSPAKADVDAEYAEETPLDFEIGPTTADGAEDTNWEMQ